MEQSAQNNRHGIRLPLGFVEIGGQEEIGFIQHHRVNYEPSNRKERAQNEKEGLNSVHHRNLHPAVRHEACR